MLLILLKISFSIYDGLLIVCRTFRLFMFIKYSFYILFLLCFYNNVKAQEMSLEKADTLKFKPIPSFSLKKIITSSKKVEWSIVYGHSPITENTHDSVTKQNFYNRIDMLQKTNKEKAELLEERCEAECSIQYVNCREKKILDSKQEKYCDSLKKNCQESCDSKVSDLEDKSDALIKELIDKFNYEMKYLIDKVVQVTSKNLIRFMPKTLDLNKYKSQWLWCPPSVCGSFIIYELRGKYEVIDSFEKLKAFIAPVDNLYDALFLAGNAGFGNSGGIKSTFEKVRYNKINTDYYFIMNFRLNDSPIEIYKCLIKVNKEGEVKMISKTLLKSENISI